ncbi:heme biosynthesis protein HemY [Oxalobacteraceae bacterium R-40]|uniref:Heme biosynthesis protein HemY n=1 Tax=Keguizhuia sedimenti TaxID=3064264 RepID=A0ABU1BMT8_9BURK|nr:heme biosynthesis protein HemY [Oxalobacteraceae bacterium R-40]
MRLFIWIIFLFAAAIGLAVAARFNPGNVVFFYPPYRIDLSMNFFIVLMGLLFVLIYGVLKAIRVTKNMPARVALYRQEKREREGNRAFRDALRALFEGRFGHSERAASRAAQSPDNTGLAALIAARAAHRLQEMERRDQWLATAAQDASLKTARLMTEIELLVDEERSEAALDAVKELNASGTRHIHALRLALKANQRARNWPEVLRLTRTLDKNNALHPALSKRLRELAYEDILADRSQDVETLRRVWSAVPAQERLQPSIALRAANAFNARGLHEDAGKIIEASLAVEWDSRLVHAYRKSAGAEGSPILLSQIERCEEWLAKRPADAELALTLGTLCLKQKLWGKAQRYLEQALSDAVDSETIREAHLKLAHLHESLNQPVEAASHFRLCALATML